MALTEELKDILKLKDSPGPFISLFMPLSSSLHDVSADRTQFNSLVTEAKRELTQNYTASDWSLYARELEKFAHDPLGNGTARGLAIFVGPKGGLHFRVAQPLSSRISIADKPEILPLIAARELTFSYDILLLGKDVFHLVKVVDNKPELVELPDDAPKTLQDALGSELGSRGHWQRSTGGDNGGTQYSGTGSLDTAENADRRNFFMVVDEYVFKNYSNLDRQPLVLVTDAKNQGNFRKLSQNPYLSKDVQLAQVANLNGSVKELQLLTTSITDKFKKAEMETFEHKYEKAAGSKRTTTDLSVLMEGAIAGQIEILFVRAGASSPGRISDQLQIDTTSVLSHDNNVYNDLALLTISHGGEVHVLPAEQIPVEADATAILRSSVAAG
ncbi:hypothetical protein JCM15457_1999 [Liquorilactobacillus sucicola DSM 21376 = JCM 15457]|uniref:Bacterial archaeo-eukaryotic release factor family 6 domain-containing protein n=1 Tax=Liquorilactobacillus sucicola DSM 21376 = JCM 15457 TaxID=1423806 RepID=A0A023CYS6_9LACO|nr:hypothetical protein [Liquorilactobacillus sucicola]KRN06768.1 hypothetical protein FD15_GL000323 [Liquorilactobacillus sucicola DSM 21376 = JCM 15457]GAJ27042.1 hypothetical protein JCM15457_1999 [Liquorilactobacillus sucicola DSM 21376 = JCM 15457]